MKLTFRFLKTKDKLALLVCLLSVAAMCWLDLKIPEYISEITLRVQTTGVRPSDLVEPGLFMLACALGSLLLAIVSNYIISGVSSNLTTRMRSAVFGKTMSFSLSEMSSFQTSSLITRCTKNIDFIYRFWADGALHLMKAVVLATMAIIKMKGANVAWLGTTAAAVFLTILLMCVIFLVTIPQMIRLQTHTDDENRFINEHLTGIRVVRAFNAQRFDSSRFSKTNEELRDTSIRVERGMSFLLPGMITVIYGLTIAIYWIGAAIISGDAVSQRAADYANMIAFSSYAMLCVQAFILLVKGLMLVPGFASSIRRVREVLDTDVPIKDGEGAQVEENTAAAIEFRGVGFRYPGAAANAITDISFTANRGETVAFIGATGSGKTTVLNLIPRLYDATEGEIRINGVDIKRYALNDLRSMIGYVPQRASLFTRSIAGNIDFGDSGGFAKTLNDIEQAAVVGQADEFIRQKSEGYQTEILPGGNNLSGGQKQRLTISRAVCRDPKIYLFDDSFSALDFATDKKLRASLKRHAKGATMLIVAQRISTIRNADRIIVLDGGRIRGMGTHDELMRTCPVYREIAETQLMSENGIGGEAAV